MLSSYTWGQDSSSAIGYNQSYQLPKQTHKIITAIRSRNLSHIHRSLYRQGLDELRLLNLLTIPPIRCIDDKLSHEDRFPWDRIPPVIDLDGAQLPTARKARKQLQIHGMVSFVIKVLRQQIQASELSTLGRRLRVVEFCAGSGSIGLPIAWFRPDIEVVLIDRKEESLRIAENRIQSAGLKNVRLLCSDISSYDEPFDVGIALHACGVASDITLIKCIEQHAGFVICPCCIGKLLPYRCLPLSHTISSCFQSSITDTRPTNLTPKHFMAMVKAADYGHHDWQQQQHPNSIDVDRRACKVLIENDRCRVASEAGYVAWRDSLGQASSPKHDVIVGWYDQMRAIPSNTIPSHTILYQPISPSQTTNHMKQSR